MIVRYTWYKKRSETRYFISRIIVSRLIAIGWIIALGSCFYAAFISISDSDTPNPADRHFSAATWYAVICIFSAGVNHLLMSLIGEMIERFDARERPPKPRG